MNLTLQLGIKEMGLGIKKISLLSKQFTKYNFIEWSLKINPKDYFSQTNPEKKAKSYLPILKKTQ